MGHAMSMPASPLAQLLQPVSAELLERLQFFSLAPQRVLAIGAGAATLMPALQQRFPKARLLAIDRSEAVLRAMPARRGRWFGPRPDRIRADAAGLPLRSGSIDLICSHLMLPWSCTPEGALRELGRVLRPGGLLAMATLGPGTLQALGAALADIAAASDAAQVADFAATADADASETRPAPVIEMHRLGDALMRAGLAEPVMDVEHFRLDECFRTAQGLPATCEVLFGAAFGTQPRGDAPTGPGRTAEVIIPFDALRSRRTREAGSGESQ